MTEGISEGAPQPQQLPEIKTEGLTFEQLRELRVQLAEITAEINKTVRRIPNGLETIDGQQVTVDGEGEQWVIHNINALNSDPSEIPFGAKYDNEGTMKPIYQSLVRYPSKETALAKLDEIMSIEGYTIVEE